MRDAGDMTVSDDIDPGTGSDVLRTAAVHAWSLDRTLGRFRAGTTTEPTGLPLLELPAALRDHGYRTVQLCHFHLPHREDTYLAELRTALAEAGVVLDAFLVDDGDLTHPGEGAREEARISSYLADAAALGATRIRVVAGRTRTGTAQADSSAALGRIAARAGDLRVVTENWGDVTRDAADVRAVLDPLDGAVGLLVDLGNWTGPGKYADLAEVAPYAETCHAKAHWNGNVVDEVDYRTSLSSILDAGYSGPLALVYDAAADDEWAGLAVQRAIVEDLLD
ncbi:Xylose isomerase domain protein TIM barrel [Kineococcus radiotolerans SRS30216 = ATCC BAA-149]|uniref:Xylose isomerase domain protein TIM barrel n=2 Tax=Kineococcus radiotolerans TaxID=131568 RepID=A6WBH6_KINRD|nr:Xylose isomerase domain protein TIM barrel [Kineococcus radiotolerans SRS30216 = ATCC BAA-149]